MLTVHSRALSNALSLVHPELVGMGQCSIATCSSGAAKTSTASTDEARASHRGCTLELEGDLAVVKLGALEVLDDILGVLAGGELDDSSTRGLTTVILHDDDLDGADLILREELLEVFLAHVEGEVLSKDLVGGAGS